MNTEPTDPTDSLSDFIDGVKLRVSRGGEWLPAFIQSDGEIQHEGEEITEEELSRRWAEDGPTGASGVKAIDVRPPRGTP
jgi:hypothetical protein